MKARLNSLIDGMLALEKALGNERKQMLVVSAISMSFALCLCVFLCRVPLVSLIAVLLSSLLLASLYSSYLLFKNYRLLSNLKKHPLYQHLHQRKKQLLWVYHIDYQISPFALRIGRRKTLVFHFQSGEEFQLRVRDQELHALTQMLLHHYPQTTLGYSAKRKQYFDRKINK